MQSQSKWIALHRFQIKREDVNCEGGKYCVFAKRLVWHGEVGDDKALVVSAVCPSIDGNSCGTFGVGLLSYEFAAQRGEENESRVCHASRVYSVPVRAFVELSLWTVGGADFGGASCYMWLSSAHVVKLPEVIQREHEALLQSLISGSSQSYPATLTGTWDTWDIRRLS